MVIRVLQHSDKIHHIKIFKSYMPSICFELLCKLKLLSLDIRPVSHGSFWTENENYFKGDSFFQSGRISQTISTAKSRQEWLYFLPALGFYILQILTIQNCSRRRNISLLHRKLNVARLELPTLKNTC